MRAERRRPELSAQRRLDAAHVAVLVHEDGDVGEAVALQIAAQQARLLAAELPLLQRDTFTFETPLAYDGGPDGLDVVRRLLAGAPGFLRGGGALLLELGAGQPPLLAGALEEHGYDAPEVLLDEDGDVRGILARRRATR